VEVRFQHPICPQINRGNFGEVDFESEFFKPPVGGLTAKTLFQAQVLYEVGRSPSYWLIGLQLDKPRPNHITPRLWAEAQWLWARTLFDQGNHQDSLRFFNLLVDEMKGRALLHQQRAWAHFFNQEFDRALGSIVSAESPLIFPVPFFEKHFLRALVEKEHCRYSDAIRTIQTGRKALSESKPDPRQHPWVILCERENLGAACGRLTGWYQRVYDQKIKSSLDDLDLLEVELRDRLTPGQQQASRSSIEWLFLGENWRDELGYYSVPMRSSCG